jgi:hypothetical protein|tara:strand:+ start:508 stop:1002 length:495 start_codon:yes stop_codon:yes gene_type:complete
MSGQIKTGGNIMATLDEIAKSESFEALCMAFKKDGPGWSITLRVQNRDLFHPDGMPFQILTDQLGSGRYMIAMVKIGEDEQPVTPKSVSQGETAVAAAGRLCRNEKFQTFLRDIGAAVEVSEDGAKLALYDHCRIASRSQLKDNKPARDMFFDLVKEFEAHGGT